MSGRRRVAAIRLRLGSAGRRTPPCSLWSPGPEGSSTMLRSMALAVALLLAGASTASADNNEPLRITASAAEAHPGDTVTYTMTYTNNHQSEDVQFSYASLTTAYGSWIDPGIKHQFIGCTGDITWCDGVGTKSLALHHAVLIHPGETRTATLTIKVAEDSACDQGRYIGHIAYHYHETPTQAYSVPYAAGASFRVVC
ncbi:hypothetical protein D5S17_28195 [Pseudonocardiaceae bacterium YIM PH 21723]|nr:hypothetical protein D5S17_28195 [Pseudonocardiaceae bacterium YIM PH 21723]